ncbi:MAG: hypothetical protein A3C13_04485 [Candidatus Lloydbacteria bacterium RIFCSPHIGHO2_02_FULL_50_11]|nr:MAG: hypothetical protein A3C13_04485 [Candidatus Lloydbacteria bacterium RIFCSPHIGHO2_02_FULL_50_11]
MFSSFFGTVTRPFLAANFSVAEWWGGNRQMLASKSSLIAENKRLNETLDRMSLGAYSREALRNENERLKAVLGRASGRSLLLARVLATPGRSPYDTLLLDVGQDDGIGIGMKVFVEGDFAIGEVSKVMNASSVVTLYSSYGNELPVTMGSSSIPASAKGVGGGNFRISLPKNAEVAVGDIVHIPSIAPQYAGVVAAVDHPEGSSLQDIYLRWPFNVHTLSWVYIATAEEVTTPLRGQQAPE